MTRLKKKNTKRQALRLDERREAIDSEFASGEWSVEGLADRYGVSLSTTYRDLRELGVEMPSEKTTSDEKLNELCLETHGVLLKELL